MLAAIQPFFTVAGLDTNCPGPASCVGQPPFTFGNGSFFENVHNTIWSSAVSWNLKNGWFTSLGFNLQGPDGSHYAGTLEPGYWTFAPTAAVAYLSKEWKIAVNADYEVHTASRGDTGTFAAINALAGGIPIPRPERLRWLQLPRHRVDQRQSIVHRLVRGIQIGQAVLRTCRRLQVPTTADTPGSGWTCAALTASAAYRT